MSISSSASSTCSSSDIVQSLNSDDDNAKTRRSKRKAILNEPSTDESIKKCLWHKCTYETSVEAHLIEHIKSKHIYTQKASNKFKCAWKQCRVYKVQSCSFNWLERHVITHVDSKPFACIINDCKRKFQTQASLERHVNSHMNLCESSSPTKSMSTSSLNAFASSSNLQATTSANYNNHTNGRGNCAAKLPRKRRLVESGNFRKAQYKDFIDDFSYKLIKKDLEGMSFDAGKIKLNAEDNCQENKMSSADNSNEVAKKKCDGLRYDLKVCLLQSECVATYHKTPKECLKDPEMSKYVSEKCFSLANAFFECKRSTIDMRSRFRGPKGY